MSQTFENITEAGPKIGGLFHIGQILSSRLENGSDAFSVAYRQHLAEVKAGNAKAIGALVGPVMKASKGKANPALLNKILNRLIKG